MACAPVGVNRASPTRPAPTRAHAMRPYASSWRPPSRAEPSTAIAASAYTAPWASARPGAPNPSGGDTVKLGYSMFGLGPRSFAEVAQKADMAGFESIWMQEHLVF